MIKKMRIRAFKSIRDLSLNFSNLNLLVGTNSSGKSTCLQSLLLMTQNMVPGVDKPGLNGAYVSLGDFRENRNYNMPGNAIQIDTWADDKEEPNHILRFVEDKENNTYKTQENNRSPYDLFFSKWGYIHYISCHRIGVQDIYQKNLQKFSEFGVDGEYALSYLLRHEEDVLDANLCVEDGETVNTLFSQVNYWLKYIIDTELLLSDLQKTNYLQVKYNNNPANSSSEALFCRPVNIGSGVSYLISILIACLGSKSYSEKLHDCIIIENPEIHLHPKAQSRLCEFFYHVCKTGRQLFVETHSDHIFNGLRVGVANKMYDPELISVNFLALNSERFETECNPIRFGAFGKIIGTNDDMDLNDLFDQFDIDLDRMLGL